MIKGKYKRIVAYGCSFASGDELGDAEALGIPEEQVDALKRSGITRSELYGNLAIKQESEKIGKNLSWVRWISEKYSVPFSNRAQAGGSLPQMVYRIERDFRNGLIDEDDLVLVGLTSMYRWFQFHESGSEQTWVFGHSTKESAEFNNSLLKYYVNEYNVFWSYYMQVNYLEMLSKEKPNLKLFHGLAPFSVEKQHNSYDINLNEHFSNTIESFKFTCLLNHDYGMSDMYSHLPEEDVTHGYGHPKVKYHKEFANLLYAWIEEKV